MKNLDLKAYCEKLKIDSITLSDIDGIQLCHEEIFSKDMLKQFDIVKINGYLFMSFLKDSIFAYTHLFETRPFAKYSKEASNGIFLWYDKAHSESHFMYFDSYLNDLRAASADKQWDISDVYIRPDHVQLHIHDAESLSEKSLYSFIEKYNYDHIKVKR